MTVSELHELLGGMLAEHGTEEVATSRGTELFRITGISVRETTGDPHGKPTFACLTEHQWPSAEWRR